MNKVKREKHEVMMTNSNSKTGDLFFGLSGTGVNSTKRDNRNDSRLREDLNLK